MHDRTGGAHGAYRHDKSDLVARLRKIEGQVRGLQKMLNEERYCVDVLVQIAAVQSALDKVRMTLIEDHTRGCVAEAIAKGGGDEKIKELMSIINPFLKHVP